MTELAFVGSEAGVSDRTFVRRLRELLRDYPVAANEHMAGNGSSTFFQLQKVPISVDKYVTVTVDNVVIPIVGSRDLVAPGNCYLDYDAGMLIFGTAPTTGTNNVAIQKQRVRWSDSVIVESLYGGLRQLFPALFKRVVDTSIMLQTNQWDYTLPQAFEDPRTAIITVGVQGIPSATNRVKPLAGAYRRGNMTLEVPGSQGFSPGSLLYIEYKAPFRSLSELEPQAYDLPLWYAAGQLLGFDEARRTSLSGQSPSSEASANPPGYQQNTGSFYMSQFYRLLDQLKMGSTRLPAPISTYQK